MARDDLPRIIDLGAGDSPQDPDALTVDIRPHNNPDIVQDLEEEDWDLPSDYFETVYMSHVLEHLENWKNGLSEMARIVKPDGTVHLTVPHYSNSIRYPDHRNHFSLNSIDSFLDPENKMYLPDAGLKVVERELRYSHNRASIRGKIGYILNPVVDSRFRKYIGRYFWPFIGGLDEIYWKLKPR